MNGDFVQPFKPIWLRDTILNHHGVEVFHIGDADQLIDVRIVTLDVRIVTLIALQVWVCNLPLLMCLTKQRDIQHVCLVRIDDVHLGTCDSSRNEVLLNCIRVDAVVDLRQFALRRPAKLRLLRRLKPLKFVYEIQLKKNANRRSELKRNILLGILRSTLRHWSIQSTRTRLM